MHPLRLLAKDDAEFEMMRVKMKLMLLLSETKKQLNVNQTVFAKMTETTQARISHIMNGRMSKITIDALLSMCHKVGVKYEISFE